MSELEYKANDYLSLKLEDERTFIYVKDERFLSCIRLMLQIPKDNIDEFEEINSIDEAASLHKTLFQNSIFEDSQPHTISPEQEFWGHCSNIQAWVENEYDSRLLHSNIAFPLLRKLSKAGDPLARKVLKEEVAERFTAGYLPVSIYLINEDFLHIFNEQELNSLLETFMEDLKKIDDNYLKKQSKIELNDIGRAFNEVGQYEKAIYILSKALKLDPNYAVALNNMGISYYYGKDYKTAKVYYSKATENDPYDALAWSNLSEIYDIEGDFKKAVQMAQKALNLKPKLYEALFFYAHANYKLGNYNIAIGCYKIHLKRL
jgi:tetratricopeptide (TPR) repeat protein